MHYSGIWANTYFGRTKDRQEIDYVEEKDGAISAFEFKWNVNKQPKINSTFKAAYHIDKMMVISLDNVEEFLL